MPISGWRTHPAVASQSRPDGLHLGTERGQAAVELVALLPLLAAVVAVVAQLVLAGHAAWGAAAAARAGARAEAVGHDARQAARDALPVELRGGLRIVEGADGAITVHVEIPAVTPGLELGHTSARARFPAQGA